MLTIFKFKKNNLILLISGFLLNPLASATNNFTTRSNNNNVFMSAQDLMSSDSVAFYLKNNSTTHTIYGIAITGTDITDTSCASLSVIGVSTGSATMWSKITSVAANATVSVGQNYLFNLVKSSGLASYSSLKCLTIKIMSSAPSDIIATTPTFHTAPTIGALTSISCTLSTATCTTTAYTTTDTAWIFTN